MESSQFTTAVAVLLVLLMTCHAQFDVFRSRELASVGGNTSLLMDSARSKRRFDRAVRLLRRKFPTCRPNVCIAIDGSDSIDAREFELQKQFTVLLVAAVGGLEGSQFAVVEYGGIVDPVFELQPPSVEALVTILADESLQSPITFVGPGIQWCTSQFSQMPAAVNKIVILGDCQSTFADRGPFGAIGLAKAFEEDRIGNAICTGLVGRGDSIGNRAFFLELVRGVRARVNAVSRWPVIVNIITALVGQICDASA